MPDLSLLDADSKAQMTPEQLQEFADFADTPPVQQGPPAPTAEKPNEVSIDPDTFSKLSFEQLSEFKNHFPAGTSIRVGQRPKADTGNRPVDLDPDSLKQLTPDQLVEFAKQTKWSPYTWAQSHPEHLDVETKTKLAQTDVALRKQGWTWADIPVGEVVTALPSLAKGVFDYAKLAAQSSLAPEAPGRIKAQSELTAATETATMGTADLARRIYNKTGRFLHLQKPLEDYTPEDALNLFENELAIRNQMAKVVSGQGEITQALGGEGLKQLQETGVKLDETAIQSASAGDPISFAAFGGGFKIFNAVTGKVVGYAASQSAALQAVKKLGVIRDSVARAEKLATAIPSAENISAANREVIMQGAERGAAGPLVQSLEQAAIAGEKAVKFVQEAPGVIAGRATQGLGEGIRLAAKGIQKAAPYGIIGTLAQGNIPAAIGSFVAQVTRPMIEKAGVNIAKLGKTVAGGAAPGGTWARAVEDLSKVPGQAIGGAAKGFPMDFGLMALSAETPEEQRESPFMATAFGAAHGLLLGGRGFAKGQLLAPRPWTPSDSWSKSYGNFPELDRAHQETMRIASPGVKQRLGALRDVAAAVGTEMYQFSGADSLAKFLESQGKSPEDARAMAEANGMILGELKDSKGESRKVALLRDPESAPHEVSHPLEENLSQEQQIWYYNELIKSHGEPAIMDRAKQEALALATTPDTQAEATVTPDSWKNFLLRISGDGPVAAEGKVAQDPSLAGKPWDLVLTEQEKNELVKRYALKEISADTIGKALEHNGAGLAKDSTVLGVAARTIARLLTFLGVDPYAGETAGSQETPIKYGALEAAKKVIGPALVEARGGTSKPTIELPKSSRSATPFTPPGTPAEESKRTEEIAASAPETPTGPEIDSQSPREILGIFSEAKASGAGVKITRRSAPGTPAGAMEVTRKNRRVQIEKARTIPDDQKPLWEKNFTPVKTVVLKDGSLQEQGWSPEVLAANAEKTARFVAENSPSLSPFELDVARKTFTPGGWKDLFDKINIYAQNQAAGLTGKGTPLEIGRAREFGFFEPAGDRISAGTLTDAEANFINYLFGFPLPGEGKPTLSRGGKAQFGVQLISEATEPGRAKPLIDPRTFESSQAEQLGFAGEQMLEVNPLRTEIEQLAKAAGKSAPSPIEAWQNLNVRDIVKAEIAPELPAVRPVGVTIRAGFQPMPANPRAVRSAAVRDEFGKIFEGSWHGEAFMRAQEAPGERGALDEGFIANDGSWYSREKAAQVAQEIGQLPKQVDAELESGNFERSRAFQSKRPEWTDIVSTVRELEGSRWLAGGRRSPSPKDFQDATLWVAQNLPSDRLTFPVKEIVEEIYSRLESKGSTKFQSKPLTKEQAEREDMPLLDKNQFMLTVVGPNGERYPARFDGWQENLPGKPPMAQITPKVNFPFQGEAVRSTTYDASLEQKGYKIEGLPERPAESTVAFQSKKEEQPRVGLEFKKFFSDVTKGTFGKSDKPFEPIVDLSDAKDVVAAKTKHSGNFDDHIAKSIPTFYETQIKKAKAIAEVFGDSGARVLDIAASEGSFGKTISDLTGGKVKTVSLDPNSDMANFFETKSKVPGATYAQEAFLHGFEDAGKEYPAHSPAEPYDVITEAMGFQFIDPDRGPQIAEVKRLLKPDGVFLTEEKVKNPDWAANEAKKDRDYKAKYFSTDELKQKDTRVGFAQAKDEVKAVGMVNNMADQAAFEQELQKNFKHVIQYWDSGNFKGYAAGDDAAKVNAIVSAMGNTKSEFSTTELPRELEQVPSPEEAAALGTTGARFQAKPNPEIARVADDYKKEKQVRSTFIPVVKTLREDIAKEISDYHDAQPKEGIDQATRDSYNAFNKETLAQFEKLRDAGYVMEPWEGAGEPYKNSEEMRQDLQDNKHLFYLKSESALGDEARTEQAAKYPPLENSGVEINGQEVPFNDLFRAVHDVFGHGAEGRTFSKDGEFQAWQDHAKMYSEAAQPALALETLAYNAWFNAGKHLRRPTGELPRPGETDFKPLHERGYAPRKTYLFPQELINKALGNAKFQSKKKTDEGLKFKKSKTGFSKAWILPSGEIQQLGGEFHHEFLNRSPELLEKYGIPSTDSSESNRQDALAKGFARVNWEDRGGRLTVEARLKDWRKIKNRVLDIAEKNLDDIDNMSVYLYNDDVTQVVDQAHSKLFQFDDNYEKTQHLPFITEGEPGVRKSLAFQSKQSGYGPLKNRENKLTDEEIDLLTAERGKLINTIGPKKQRIEELLSRVKKAKDIAQVERLYGIPKQREELANLQRRLEEVDIKLAPWDAERDIRYSKSAEENIANPPGPKEIKGETVTLEDFDSKLNRIGPNDSLSGPAWILPDGTGVEVPIGAMYHSDSVAGFHEFGNPVDVAQNRGAMRVATFDSPRQLQEFGDGHLGISVTRKPSEAQIQHIQRMLKETAYDDEKTPMFGKISIDIQNDAGDVIAGQSFESFEKGKAIRFLRNLGQEPAKTSFQSKAPAKEDFENPDTLKTALASPGWAIVTGTQEALGPWNDPANLRANKKLENELKSRGLEYITVDGEYKGKPQGDSFLVLGISPEEAHDLGVKYKQESVVVPEGLLYGDNTIVPGRTEDTKIGPDAKKEEFFSTTPGGIPFSIPFDFDKPYKPVGVQTSLFGEAELSVKDAIKKRINSKVSARKEEYPESLPLGYRKDEAGNYVLDKKTGKPIPEKQDYDFMDSALAKEAGKGLRGEAREKAYVDAAGDKLIESYQDAIKDPKVKAGEKWYSTLRVRLKKLFGKQSQLVCEILAALSARTPVETNYKFGIDALNKFNRGDYDAQLKKYQEGIDNWDAGKIDDYVQNTGSTNPNRASYLNWWINTHDLKPRQSNGKLFAANSKALLRALHGSWEGGKKTRQFSQNMSGEDFNSTIDVWAARELHRVSNEGLTDRWRILPENENAVQDEDFDIAQKVWRNSAEKIKVKPDTLQGILWFYTKELYKKRGWTKGAGGEKSDFSSLISETERRPTGEFRLKTPQLMMEDLVEPRY